MQSVSRRAFSSVWAFGRHSRSARSVALGALLSGCFVAAPAGAADATHTITDLGSLGGGAAAGTAINNLGQVVGTAEISTGAFDAFLWNNCTMTDLGTNFSPAAVNDSGVIVGGQLVCSGGTLQNLFSGHYLELSGCIERGELARAQATLHSMERFAEELNAGFPGLRFESGAGLGSILGLWGRPCDRPQVWSSLWLCFAQAPHALPGRFLLRFRDRIAGRCG
jgi:probable HAF family extracellular repeat protein